MGLEVVQLTKSYPGGIGALRQITFAVNEGVLALLGPRGAGKSTLLAIAATLQDPSSGSVLVDGLDVRKQKPEVRRRLGFVPPQPSLPRALTVEEVLEYAALLHGIDQERARGIRIERALERFELGDVRQQRLGALDPEIQTRVALAQAYLPRPSLLLLDDPGAELAPAERQRLRARIADVGREMPVVVATRDTTDVEAAATSVAVLHRGALRFFGPPAGLAGMVAGKVWGIGVGPQEEIRSWPGFLCTGQRRAGADLQFRGVAAAPPKPDAQPLTPTLGDAYAWLLEQPESNAAVGGA